MLGMMLEAAIRSLILGAAAWASLACLRAKNPIIRLTVWTGVLYAAIAMPLLVMARHALLPILPAAPVWSAPVEAVMSVPSAVTARISSDISSSASEISSGAWPNVLATIYGAVALILLLRLGLGLARGWALRHRATRLEEEAVVALYVSYEVTAPMVFGSAIILPPDSISWPAGKRAAVLAHEASHISRGDFTIQLLAAMHRAIFWFSPLAWWLYREMAALAELASDDAAAQSVGDRLSYAEILIEVARDARPLASGVAMAHSPAISLRIARLLSGTANSASLPRTQRVMIGGAGASILLAALTVAPGTLATSHISFVAAGHSGRAGNRPNIIDRIFVPFVGTEDARRETVEARETPSVATPPSGIERALPLAGQIDDGRGVQVPGIRQEYALDVPAQASGFSAQSSSTAGQPAGASLPPVARAQAPQSSQNRAGIRAYLNKDFAEAARLFTAGTSQGDLMSTYMLGTLYLTGQGVPEDGARAIALYRQAAEAGYGPAMLTLSQVMSGAYYGIARDKAESDNWLRRWAKTDDPFYTPEMRARTLAARNVQP